MERSPTKARENEEQGSAERYCWVLTLIPNHCTTWGGRGGGNEGVEWSLVRQEWGGVFDTFCFIFLLSNSILIVNKWNYFSLNWMCLPLMVANSQTLCYPHEVLLILLFLGKEEWEMGWRGVWQPAKVNPPQTEISQFKTVYFRDTFAFLGSCSLHSWSRLKSQRPIFAIPGFCR